MAEEQSASPAKAGPDLKALHPRYLAEIDAYEREAGPWHTRGKKILALYKDDKNTEGKKKRFNILWSNVQTLKPALYARDPKPEIERRYKAADPIARVGSEVLERCASYTIACHGFSDVMRQCVEDRLLPGRGVPWVRYIPTLAEKEEPPKTQPTEATQQPPAQDPQMEVLYEQALIDYVYWEDFGHNIARFWDEVWLVWRRVYMTRDELVAEFGTIGATIPLDHGPKNIKDEKLNEHLRKACIYEMWDKKDGAVLFLSKSHPEVIKYVPDPLGLNGGFPCPRPLYATTTNDSLIPTPDYALYQTQASELESLTARINNLQKALKVAGVYDSSAPALAGLLNDNVENKLLPVDSWARFAEKGGLEGAIDFIPIKEVAEVLIGLYEAREKSKADLYEITGIADIIRGNSEPNETATAQQIKGRFAVLRISDSQQDVQRLARDTIRLITEIIAEHFSLDTIKAISGVQLLHAVEKQAIQAMMQRWEQMKQSLMQGVSPNGPQPPMPPAPPIDPEKLELLSQPTWEEVHEMIRHDVVRDFRIEIETDSTVRTDEDAEKVARNEFLTAVGGYLRSSMEAGMMAPELMPLMSELLMFAIRAFKVGRQVEPVFEETMKKLQERAKQPKPDPEMQKVQAQMQLEQQKAQTTAQLEREKMQLTAQGEQAKQNLQSQQAAQETQMEIARAEREAQLNAEIERHKAELDLQLQREKAAMELEKAIAVERIKAESALEIERMRQQTQLATHESKLAAEGEARKDEQKGTEERDTRRSDSLKQAKEIIGELKSLKAAS